MTRRCEDCPHDAVFACGCGGQIGHDNAWSVGQRQLVAGRCPVHGNASITAAHYHGRWHQRPADQPGHVWGWPGCE